MRLALAATAMLVLPLMAACGLLPAHEAVGPADSARLSATQLREDLRSLRDAIAKTHPDIRFSADTAELESAFARVDDGIRDTMTQDEAWRLFALLNPVFQDAHVSVISPQPQRQVAALHRVAGGLFPLEVHVDELGDVYVLSKLGGQRSEYASSRIERINGIPVRDVSSALLARTNGDTPAFRSANLSRRWWWFYWKVFGAPPAFDLALRSTAGSLTVRNMTASKETPAWLKDDAETDFDRAFSFEHLPDGVGLLTLNTFSWPEKKRFYDFTHKVFAQLRSTGTTVLVIDIRNNGGGDDDMWKEGLLRYLARRPYRHGSSFLLKVIEGRQRGDQKVGELVQGQIETWSHPRLDEPLRFDGKVYVLVGRHTYSSAVLFANVMQDHGFGALMGVGGHARARQSGGTQVHTLPHSGLRIVVPRFILDRPSGARTPALLSPDIPLEDDPFDPRRVFGAWRARRAAAGEME